MKRLRLVDIVCNIGADCDYYGEEYIYGVSVDTRTLKKGDLFIAIKGSNYNGHDFVQVAEEKGACAIVCSEDIVSYLPVLKVRNTLLALQKLAKYYRAMLSLKVVAVTGSNGKTTTKNMVSSVLSSKYRVFSTDRNYNNEIGLPMSILELDDSYDVAVLEIGMNHLGEIKKLSDIAKPDVGIITNIGKAHIGNLRSQENILKAKLEIISGLKSSGLLILNSDDKFLRDIKPENFKVSFVGLKQMGLSEITVTNIEFNNSSTSFKIIYGNEEYFGSIPVLGKHNVSDTLFAVRCGLHFGIDIREALEQLKVYAPSPMRCEKSEVNGVTILKDYYNSSPESAESAIEVLSHFNSESKKIAILGEMSELGEESFKEHFNLACLCRDNQIDYVFFIGKDFGPFKDIMGNNGAYFNENERVLFLGAIRKYVEKGFISSGDTVLIKGSRQTKMEEIYESLKTYLSSQKSDYNLPCQSATHLYVDMEAIKFNYSQIKRFVGENVKILPMVKANAYGAGSRIISNVFQNNSHLAVADIQEANTIRNVLPNSDLVIIYQPRLEDIQEIVDKGYIPAVSDLEFAKKLNEVSLLQNRITKVHVEVDTGHGRLGISPEEVINFAKGMVNLKNLEVEGIFMHYSSADVFSESDLEFTHVQTSIFTKAVNDFENVYGNIKYKHACAGAAIFNPYANHFNMVRPGYILYGYYPNDEIKEKITLKPSLKLTSTILQIREVNENTPISYNRRFVTKHKSKIATISVGYSDGLPRKLFNMKNKKNGCFVVNGQRAPIVGSICMDLTMIDITNIKGDVKVGDDVSIFDNINVTIEEIAEICDTIGYEIISQISDKIPRVEFF